ncbi:MAG: hypothetical protein CL678_10150 [Bdellovibrionaceae bacterium]|nr:hypothetical protein [Pseudobdellovibrionaceae bacterium]|tara:strand:- start:7559 stop:8572 length:1014 start_codon:yes stop_codon:yes gene_type:complete
MIKKAFRFQTAKVGRQDGERARLKVVEGPDKGAVYVLISDIATLGRGENADVVLMDLKASREHAHIKWDGNQWSVSDQNSANGIFLNKNPVKTSIIKSGDFLTIGNTSFEFLDSTTSTRILEAIPSQLHNQRKKTDKEKIEEMKIEAITSIGGIKKFMDKVSPSGEKNKRPLIYISLIVVFGFLLFLDDGKNKAKKNVQTKKEVELDPNYRDLSSYLPETKNPVLNKSAEKFFKLGFREYQQKNYLRAKKHFETVLQVVPTHHLARLYLTNCKKAIDEEIKFHLMQGKRGLASGKLKSSHGHYEAVQRLLHTDQTSPAYIEATEQISTVEKKMKGEM